MDKPVTNVVFVCSKDKCPDGYTMIEETPCGHEANLWEKFLGGKSEDRFICFTKKDEDGEVVEDLYIPGRNERTVYRGYHTIKYTVEEEDSLNEQYLAMKRVPKAEAKKAVYDIAVFRCKDKPAKCFKKLGAKLNGMYICVRIEDYDHTAVKAAVPAPSCPSHSPAVSPDPSHSSTVSSDESDSHLADTVQQLAISDTPPPSSPPVGNGSVGGYPPAPVEEPATCVETPPAVEPTAPLLYASPPPSDTPTSTPPPSVPQAPPAVQNSTPNQQFYPPQNQPSAQPVPQQSQPQQPGPFRHQDQRRTVSAYPSRQPPSQSVPRRTTGSVSSYPARPPPAPVSGYGPPYQQGPGSSYPPQQPAYGAPYMQQSAPYPPGAGYNTGYPPSAQYPAAGGYPPAPLNSSYGFGAPSYGTPNYSAAGTGFVGAPVNHAMPTGPAPYNPYQQQQGGGGYPNNNTYPQRPPNNSTSYGFKF